MGFVLPFISQTMKKFYIELCMHLGWPSSSYKRADHGVAKTSCNLTGIYLKLHTSRQTEAQEIYDNPSLILKLLHYFLAALTEALSDLKLTIPNIFKVDCRAGAYTDEKVYNLGGCPALQLLPCDWLAQLGQRVCQC